ncbi:MAG: FAD-dependent oxidoreductase [Nocardioidaceae bacterium]|nr:FAD-dependent oxidoreductase [Nocardioidaceae bacterium]
MNRPRVVIAGLGDSGLLTAIHLARAAVDVIGISNRPGLVSGQELGLRLARPDAWQRDYRIGFDRFRRLDGAEVLHAELVSLDLDRRVVEVRSPRGARLISYDVLVVATGVTNGFWRPPGFHTEAEVTAALESAHTRLAHAEEILVVGGGAAAASAALQIAVRWPAKAVGLALPGERGLVHHHPRTWHTARRRLEQAGVRIETGHRAVLPADTTKITDAAVTWTTGQPPTTADAVVWAVGRVRPNTDWLPAELRDRDGFVPVEATLQVPGRPEVFALGDVSATDPLRSSARNRADRLAAANITAHLAGRSLGRYSAAPRRWGSVLGPERDGLRVFTPSGRAVRVPRWIRDRALQPWIVQRGIYRGVRGEQRER